MTQALPRDDLRQQQAGIESVLRMVGVATWPTPIQVLAYKNRELAAAPPPSRYWERRYDVSLAFSYARQAVEYLNEKRILVLRCAVVALLLECLAFTFFGTWQGLLFTAGPTLLVAAAYDFGIPKLAEKCARWAAIELRGPAAWRTIDYNNYKRDNYVPPEARALVRQVRQHRPGARVIVHELYQDKYVLDPLLEIDGIVVLAWDKDRRLVDWSTV